MSEQAMSSPQREPLSGTLRQGKKVVGGVCLPEEDIQNFIDQFNHCYGPMGLKIDQPVFVQGAPKPKKTVPVGAGLHNPFRARSAPTSDQQNPDS
jgi:hypothetical protein